MDQSDDRDAGCRAHHPDRSSATTSHAFNRDLYRLRNRVECFFNKPKQFRRIATRYEKIAANYLAMINIATIRIRLQANESTAQWLRRTSIALSPSDDGRHVLRRQSLTEFS